MSSKKRAVSVLFDDDEYAGLVRIAAEMTLNEGRRVSVAEFVRRATLSEFGKQTSGRKTRSPSKRTA